MNTFEPASGPRRIGLIDLPHLASELTAAGYDVITGEDFRSAATAIRSEFQPGKTFPIVVDSEFQPGKTFPIVVDDASVPGLRVWTTRLLESKASVGVVRNPDSPVVTAEGLVEIQRTDTTRRTAHRHGPGPGRPSCRSAHRAPGSGTRSRTVRRASRTSTTSSTSPKQSRPPQSRLLLPRLRPSRLLLPNPLHRLRPSRHRLHRALAPAAQTATDPWDTPSVETAAPAAAPQEFSFDTPQSGTDLRDTPEEAPAFTQPAPVAQVKEADPFSSAFKKLSIRSISTSVRPRWLRG